MSLLEHIHHPDLKADQRLLIAIDELGIATRQHIAMVLGWTENSVQTYIHRWRRKGPRREDMKRLKELKQQIHTQWSRKSDAPLSLREEYNELFHLIQESRNEWIHIYNPPKHAHINCYKLGVQALEYIQEFSSRPGRVEELSDFHWGHYLGVNDILVRLMKAVQNQEEQHNLDAIMQRITWYGTREATEYLFRRMEMIYREEWIHDPKKARNDRRQIIRPDAYAFVDGQRYWIEYDNSSEGPRKIEDKLEDYVITLNRIGNTDPIVWVARDKKRRDELKDIWSYKQMDFVLKEEEEDEKDQDNAVSFIPEMHFFKAGDEVEFFVPSLVSA